jgi:hypothetical protein
MHKSLHEALFSMESGFLSVNLLPKRLERQIGGLLNMRGQQGEANPHSRNGRRCPRLPGA